MTTGTVQSERSRIAYEYDDYGKLIRETVYTGPQSSEEVHSDLKMKWDEAGRREQLAAGPLMSGVGNAGTFDYRYHANGKMRQVSYAGNNASSFSYNTAGLLEERINPWRNRTILTYDARGLPKDISTHVLTYANPFYENLNYRRDGKLANYSVTGRPDSAPTPNEYRNYTYNRRGQLIDENISPEYNAEAMTTAYDYGYDHGDAGLGVRTSATRKTPDSIITDVEAIPAEGGLDGFGRMTNQTLSGAYGGTTTQTVTGVSEGAVGVTIEVEADGVDSATHDFTFDLNNHFANNWSFDHTFVRGVDYTITGHNKYFPAPSQYQHLVTQDGPADQHTVHILPEEVDQEFDEAGNVIRRTWRFIDKEQILSWDALGRLVKVRETNQFGNGFEWEAVYDPLGRRIKTETMDLEFGLEDALTKNTVLSTYDPLVEFMEIAVEVVGDERYWKAYGPDHNGAFGALQGIGGLEATIRESDGEVTAIIFDHYANVVANVKDGDLKINWTEQEFTGYGVVPGQQVPLLTEGVDLVDTLGWHGRRLEATGFYYMGARDYDPVSGKFLSPDPAGHGASMSLYCLCRWRPNQLHGP